MFREGRGILPFLFFTLRPKSLRKPFLETKLTAKRLKFANQPNQMISESENRRLQRKARTRVLAKRGFYIHFGVFAIVSLFLFAINVLTSNSVYWFYYPVLSWGLAVAIHYLVTFGVPGTDILSQEWEQREMERELYILQRKQGMAKDQLLHSGTSEDLDELELREPVKVNKNWDEDLV